MSTGRKRLLAIAATLALTAAACGGGDDTTDTETDTGTDAGQTATDTETDMGSETGSEAMTPTYENADEGVHLDSVDYGLIYDQTGPTASTQTLFGAGFLAHIQAVNDAGGVNGRTINVLEEDEKYDVAAGVAAYNKLVDQTPVVGMTALNNSSYQGAVIEDVDANGVPVIGAESTTQTAVVPFREMFFAMECTYADQADVAVAYSTTMSDDGSVPRTATIYGNVASGEEYANNIKDRVEASGGEYVGSVSLEYGSTEADAQAQQIAELDPEVIHLHGGVSIGTPVLASLAKFGITDVPVVGIFAMHNNDVPLAAPEVPFAAVNCYSNGYEDVDGADQLIADAQAAGDDQATWERPEYVNGWMVAQVVVEAMKRAGDELNRQSLADAVESIDSFQVGALSPEIQFGPDDHVGVQAVKPFEFDPESETYSGVGEYSDWADCISNQYVNDGLGDWTAVGCYAGS